MARTATDARTSMWLKTVKPDPVEDVDTPLDFSSKKVRSPEPEDDTGSEEGSTASSCNGTPATMAAVNPLLRQTATSLSFSYPNIQSLPSFSYPSHLVESRNKNNKPIRPFKAYPREPMALPLGLYGLPMNLNLTGNIFEALNPQFMGTKDAYAHYKRHAEAAAGNAAPHKKSQTKASRKSSKPAEINGTNGHQVVSSSIKVTPADAKEQSRSTDSVATMSPKSADSAAITTTGSPAADNDRSESKTPDPNGEEDGKGKKRARSVPDDVKDEAYWERRRKNNEAAKRSRDARRTKEDEIAMRATILESENLQLRTQVITMKTQIEQLRSMLLHS